MGYALNETTYHWWTVCPPCPRFSRSIMSSVHHIHISTCPHSFFYCMNVWTKFLLNPKIKNAKTVGGHGGHVDKTPYLPLLRNSAKIFTSSAPRS